MKIFPALILGLALYCGVCAFYAPSQAAAKSEGSIYSYSTDDIPEVFFFPKERARWDGTKVTVREWYMLTDLQKEKFISEYLGEIKKQYRQTIETLGLNCLNGLDLFSYYSNEKAQAQPTTKFIDLIIEGGERSEVSVQRKNKSA